MEANIQKPTSMGVWSSLALVEEKPVAGTVTSSNIFDENYLVRLRSGDEDTAKHFDSYFRRMLRIKLWAKYGRTVQR